MLFKDYNIVMAEEGNLIYRRTDDEPIGIGICLGIHDSIDNYYEATYTQEEWDKLYGNNEEENNEDKI